MRSSGTSAELSVVDALAAHLREHAEHIEHREGRCRSSPARGSRRSSGWSSNSNAHVSAPSRFTPCFAASSVLARETRRGVARVHRAVAVAELRALARRAAFGIGLADHDRLALQLGHGGDHLEAAVDRRELIGDPHPHVAVDELGEPFAWNARKSVGVPTSRRSRSSSR